MSKKRKWKKQKGTEWTRVDRKRIVNGREMAFNSNGYQVENGRLAHREIYKKHWGLIPKGWVVHHINFVKTDNDPMNLIAMPEKLHGQLHDRFRNPISREDTLEFMKSQIVPKEEVAAAIKELEEITQNYGHIINRFHHLKAKIGGDSGKDQIQDYIDQLTLKCPPVVAKVAKKVIVRRKEVEVQPNP